MFLEYRKKTRAAFAPAGRETVLRAAIALAVFPILALVHLSIGLRQQVATVRDPSLRNYLHENSSIDIGKAFRGYTATIWIDKYGEIGVGPTNTPLQHPNSTTMAASTSAPATAKRSRKEICGR